MSLYYSDDLVTLHLGDAREILPLAADVVLTDPPYAVAADGSMLGFVSPNWSEKETHSRGYADHDRHAFARLLAPVFQAIGAALPPGAPVVAFCGNRTMHQMVALAESAGLTQMDYLIFIAGRGVAKSVTTLAPEHEMAAFLRTPGKPVVVNADWKRGNVYTINKGGRMESQHLTTKPLNWMRALVEDFSSPGQTILDPFAGSGTTLRAAKDLGRKAVGIELEERYCEIAADRLSQQAFDLGALA